MGGWARGVILFDKVIDRNCKDHENHQMGERKHVGWPST